MDNMLEMFASLMGNRQFEALGNTLGLSPSNAKQASVSALPLLIKGLAQNTKDQAGAASLSNALDRDHDGDVLDDLGALFSGGPSSDGQKIVQHVFGSKLPGVENTVSRLGGIDLSAVGKLLPLLAPMVLGMLGKKKKEQGLDPSGLASLLNSEEQRVERRAPEATGLFSALLDRDGDGQVMDDVLDIGGSLLKGLFR